MGVLVKVLALIGKLSTKRSTWLFPLLNLELLYDLLNRRSCVRALLEWVALHFALLLVGMLRRKPPVDCRRVLYI